MIYVIIGSTGEYSDRSEWPVCWRTAKEDAQQVVEVCSTQAKAWEAFRDSPEGIEQGFSRYHSIDAEHLSKMFDKQFRCDYTGTSYYIWEVPDDPTETAETKLAWNGETKLT